MSEQLVIDLKVAIASSSRKPLIVCGAGVSVSATCGDAPSWAGLLESGIRKILSLDGDEEDWATYARSRLKKPKATEWTQVADEITQRLGGPRNAEFAEWIEESVGRLKVKSNELVDAIRGLGCPVATTNYDDVLSIGLGVPPITWDDADQVHRFLVGNLDGVLHLHGHWRRPKTIALGSASYDMLNGHTEKRVLSQFAALDRSTVYIGCSADGLSDPDFTQLAGFLNEWQQSAPRSYWLVPSNQFSEPKTPLPASNPRLFRIPFGDAYEELPAFIRGLSTGDAAATQTAIAVVEPVSDALSEWDSSDPVLEKIRQSIPLPNRHIRVRQAEQIECAEALAKDHAAWIIAEWGMGTLGFVASVQARLGEASAPLYKIDLKKFQDREEMLNSIRTALGCSFERLCELLSNKGVAYLLFDDVVAGPADSPEILPGLELESIINVVREYSPALRILLRSRSLPAGAQLQVVELKPLEEPDLLPYLEDAQTVEADLTQPETISRLYRHTDGVPVRIDTALRELEVVGLNEVLARTQIWSEAQALLKRHPDYKAHYRRSLPRQIQWRNGRMSF